MPPTTDDIKPAPGEMTLGDTAGAGKPDMRADLMKAAMAVGNPAADAPEPPAPPKDTPKPAATPPVAKETPKPPTPEPPKAEPKEPKGIKEVREALERQTAKVKELEASGAATTQQMATALQKQADLESKLSARESEIEKDYKPRMQRLADAEKRLQELDEKMRIHDYTSTSEFHGRFIKPLADARAEAESLMGELEVNDNGQARVATMKDFDAVLTAPSLNEAARRARILFGDEVFQTVVAKRNSILSLDRRRREAISNAALESAEWQKRNEAEQATNRETAMARLLKASEEALGDIRNTDDPELQEALKDGLKFADESIHGNPKWTRDQLADTLGKARAKIAKSSVLEKRVAKLEKQLAEKDELLKQYQVSEPEVVARTTAPKPSGQTLRDRLAEDMDKFASSNRY